MNPWPCYIKGVQKQPFADILQNRSPGKFFKIHSKTPVLESLFNKVAGLKGLHHNDFSMIFPKHLSTPHQLLHVEPYQRVMYALKQSQY